ncbi:HU family DNA-binding protein [Patescibacteria group bacterium]|nr:HU family DNA-binding protein [Patescibacteria group bacterium]MBU1992063.1 HU family DNA-binding protein [Patescibacteria group bacterium]
MRLQKNPTIRHSDVVRGVANKTALNEFVVEVVLKKFYEFVIEEIKNGNGIEMVGLGYFDAKIHKDKKINEDSQKRFGLATNIQRSRRAIKFRVLQRIKEDIRDHYWGGLDK